LTKVELQQTKDPLESSKLSSLSHKRVRNSKNFRERTGSSQGSSKSSEISTARDMEKNLRSREDTSERQEILRKQWPQPIGSLLVLLLCQPIV
jgi:hypothetical protein